MEIKKTECCDPTWNYIPRTFLFYVLPLGLMSFFFYNEQIGLHRDFLVPIIFAFIVPFVHVRKKCWAFKDYQNRDCFYWTIPFVFAGIWMLSLTLVSGSWLAVIVFVGLFMLFDFLLLKFELLKLYQQPVEKLKLGAFSAFLPYGIFWWGYIGTGLFLVHSYGTDSWQSMAMSSVLLILPMYLALSYCRNTIVRREKFDNIKKVAVIGGGFSGAYATKWLAENQVEVDCFEKSAFIGGVWQFSEEQQVRGSVSRYTRATSSKHFMHAMDYRVSESFPDFPDRLQYLEYLDEYVDHFGIRENIHLNSEVRCVEKQNDEWVVSLLQQGEEIQQRYDAIVMCTGPQGVPRIKVEDDPLYCRFTGKIMHAAEYKDNSQIGDDEKILIVGAGESSADIVAECAQKNVEIVWSAHAGQWFADRNIGPFAADVIMGVGIRMLLGKFFNFEYLIRRFVQASINVMWGVGGHGVREWVPNVLYLHQFLNKSRDGVLEVYKRRVIPKRAVCEINGKQVRFEGETEAIEFDRIILATGFKPDWPSLKNKPAQLFKLVFDPADPSLSFVGLARPTLGSITSLAEMQARWIASVYAGKSELPNSAMRASIVYEESKDKRKRFRDRSELQVLTEQGEYSNELAAFMGIQVPWLKLLLLNPGAFLVMLKSPWTAFQFQLGSKDKNTREQALQNMKLELPHWRHPLYGLISFFIMLSFAIAISGGLLFYYLPLWKGCAVLALLLAGMSIFLRWKDLVWVKLANDKNAY